MNPSSREEFARLHPPSPPPARPALAIALSGMIAGTVMGGSVLRDGLIYALFTAGMFGWLWPR